MPNLVINATKPWLYLPVKAGADVRRLKISIDGQVVRDIGVEAAVDGETDWWGAVDISGWQGLALELSGADMPQAEQFLARIEQDDVARLPTNAYREALRPLVHFTPPYGWINDPNGLSCYNGEYHMFYQYTPYGINSGDKYWGHAVSVDLAHWTDIGIALAPDELGAIWSGSAVVDWNNSSGLSKTGVPPLVLIYTAAGNPFTQCLAYSTDGRNFTKYAGNPVLDNISPGNRDPKVFWHDASRRWVMALYGGFPESEHQSRHPHPIRQTIQFLTSPNLIDWTHTGEVGGFYECPDVFPLPLDGDADNVKWIAMGANLDYKVGDFDGKTLRSTTSLIKGLFGKGVYAPQTFSDIPASDGRRIQIGWLQTSSPGMPFSQSLGIPTEMRLVTTPDGPRLTWRPVGEFIKRRQAPGFVLDKPTTLDDKAITPPAYDAMDIALKLRPQTGSLTRILVNGVPIEYDGRAQTISVSDIKGRRAPMRLGTIDIRIIIDRDCLELFASGGLTYITYPLEPKQRTVGVAITAESGNAEVVEWASYELK